MGILPPRYPEETTLSVAGILPSELRGRNYTENVTHTLKRCSSHQYQPTMLGQILMATASAKIVNTVVAE